MKKILSILLLVAMLATVLTACAQTPSSEKEETSSQGSIDNNSTNNDTSDTDSDTDSDTNSDTNSNTNTNNNNDNSNTPSTTLTTEEKYNNALSLISEGKYTEAYNLLSEIKTYEPAKEKLKNFFYAPKVVDEKWKYSDDSNYRTDRITYTYNEMGNILETSNNEIFSYDVSGNILNGCDLLYGTYYTYTYKDGNLYKKTSSYDTTTYYYDSNNRLSKTVFESQYENFESIYAYTYYPSGNLKTQYDGDYYEYYYAENGQIEKVISYYDYEAKEVEMTATYTYGEYGITEIDVNAIGDQIIKFTYNYSENGHLTKLEVKSYREGTLDSEHIYTFSEHQLCYSENSQIQERISVVTYMDLTAALEIVW